MNENSTQIEPINNYRSVSDKYIWYTIGEKQFVLRDREDDCFILAELNSSETVSFYTYYDGRNIDGINHLNGFMEIKSDKKSFREAVKLFEREMIDAGYEHNVPFRLDHDYLETYESRWISSSKDRFASTKQIDWLRHSNIDIKRYSSFEASILISTLVIRREIRYIKADIVKETKSKKEILNNENKLLLAKIRKNKLKDKHGYKWLKETLDKLAIEDLKIPVYKI